MLDSDNHGILGGSIDLCDIEMPMVCQKSEPTLTMGHEPCLSAPERLLVTMGGLPSLYSTLEGRGKPCCEVGK